MRMGAEASKSPSSSLRRSDTLFQDLGSSAEITKGGTLHHKACEELLSKWVKLADQMIQEPRESSCAHRLSAPKAPAFDRAGRCQRMPTEIAVLVMVAAAGVAMHRSMRSSQ